MKVSFDVYTKSFDDANEAMRILNPVCHDYRVAKSIYRDEEPQYNVYGTIDASYVSVLSQFPQSFSEDC